MRGIFNDINICKTTKNINMIQVRSAQSEEATLIYRFIKKKAEFDCSLGGYSGTIQTTVAKIQQTLFSNCPFAYVLLTETEGTAIGFALYYFRYSSFAGQPSLWLDDLFIDTDMRNNGAGTLLMNKLLEIAKDNNCSHLAWTADARNIKGLKFYKRLGAEIIEQRENRCFLNWKV